MKYTAFLLMLIFTIGTVYAQDDWSRKRDSILKVLSAAKEDTNKAKTLLAIAMQYDASQPDSAIYYYKILRALSDKIDYVRGKITALNMTAGIYCKQNKTDAAIKLDLEALEIAKTSNNRRSLGRAYINLAIPYKTIGEYKTALEYYLKASAIAEEQNDSLTIVSLAVNLCNLYKSLKDYPKAAENGIKSIRLSKEMNNPKIQNAGLVALSSVLIEEGKYDSAIAVLKESKAMSAQLNDKSSMLFSLINLGVIYVAQNKFDSLKGNAEQLKALSDQLGNKEGFSGSLMELYSYYFYKKDYKTARIYATQALQFSKENNLVHLIAPAYHQLSLIELLEGDFASFKLHSDLSDSIEEAQKSQEILKNTEELDAKYTLTKKQTEIESLNKEKKASAQIIRQRNIINTALLAALLVLSVAGWLFYKNQQQKRKLLTANATVQQQRITELEREKQLMAANAVLQGQEEERARLARELHDGLGGILSGAKYSFNNMKDNYIITAESAAAFDRSMAMLDKSIAELRSVSHNMMPEALVTFGLDTALRDFCNSINQTGAVALAYQSFNVNDNTIPKTTASIIYRMVQELVNNILKHAGAKTALVQLVKKESGLSITVEDDGKGFDQDTVKAADGIGLKNLQSRIDFLKGTVDITTVSNKGVSINIEVPNIAQ